MYNADRTEYFLNKWSLPNHPTLQAQLDVIRNQVYEQLNIQGLLNNTTASTKNGHSALSTFNDRSHPRVPRTTPFDGEQISHSGEFDLCAMIVDHKIRVC